MGGDEGTAVRSSPSGRTRSVPSLLLGFLLLLAANSWASGILRLGPDPVSIDPSAMTLMRLQGRPPLDSSSWRFLPDSLFRPIASRDIWLGWKVGRVLLRLPVVAPSEGDWWIQVDYPGLDSVRVENAGDVTGWIGDDIVRSRWASPTHGFYLPVHLRKGVNTLHVQVVGTHGRLGLLMSLRPEWSMWKTVENGGLRDGILVGILFANLLLAIGLFFMARLPAHLWYVFYQAVVIGFIFSYHHHAFAWIWPEWLLPNLFDRTILSILAFGILGMFLLRLLDLERAFPRAGRLLKWMSLALVACAFAQLVYPWYPPAFELLYHGNRIEVLEVSTYLLAMALAFRRALQGDRTTIYVLLAMLPMAGALGVAILAEVLHLPWMFAWRGVVVEIGLLLENLALSYLLVRKLLRERREHRELLSRHVTLEQSFSRRLSEETERHLRGTAMDLHDGIGQDLAGLGLYIRTVLQQSGNPKVADRVSSEMSRVMESVRASAHRIYPPELTEGGLRHALERLAARVGSSEGMSLEIRGSMEGLSEEASLQWYRIAQEAIANAHQHGGARRIKVDLAPGRMEVTDDGTGPAPGVQEGFGLRSIRLRAASLGCSALLEAGSGGGGHLRIASTPVVSVT
jgi:signal transduction histidine kinase